MYSIGHRTSSKVVYEPSIDPAQAYPIIFREKLAVAWDASAGQWLSTNSNYDCLSNSMKSIYWGDTPLIATMRCYVAMWYGPRIDIPEELL